MSESIRKHHDNTMVRRLKWGYEYFSITFQDPEPPTWPNSVSLSCYCVPGRIDSYRFDQIPATPGLIARVRFCSEGHVNLPRALKMLHADLEKPQVVELIKRAVGKENLIGYSRTFVGLLEEIAPKAKATRAARRLLDKVIAQRRERFRQEQNHSQTLLKSAGLLPKQTPCKKGLFPKEKPCKSCSS